MPSTFGVPYSMRHGYSSRCARCADRTPVPPARVRRMFTPSCTYMPPMPVGPISDLWPVKHRTSMFIACTSIGIFPAVCEASTTRWMPCSRQIFPISPAGCTVPITFEP